MRISCLLTRLPPTSPSHVCLTRMPHSNVPHSSASFGCASLVCLTRLLLSWAINQVAIVSQSAFIRLHLPSCGASQRLIRRSSAASSAAQHRLISRPISRLTSRISSRSVSSRPPAVSSAAHRQRRKPPATGCQRRQPTAPPASSGASRQRRRPVSTRVLATEALPLVLPFIARSIAPVCPLLLSQSPAPVWGVQRVGGVFCCPGVATARVAGPAGLPSPSGTVPVLLSSASSIVLGILYRVLPFLGVSAPFRPTGSASCVSSSSRRCTTGGW